MILLSSFSLSMIEKFPANLKLFEISKDEVQKLIDENKITFKIGHPSYAQVLSEIFKVKIQSVRETIKLKENEEAIVAQLFFQRLPEGKVLTQEEIKRIPIKFIKIKLTGGKI